MSTNLFSMLGKSIKCIYLSTDVIRRNIFIAFNCIFCYIGLHWLCGHIICTCIWTDTTWSIWNWKMTVSQIAATINFLNNYIHKCSIKWYKMLNVSFWSWLQIPLKEISAFIDTQRLLSMCANNYYQTIKESIELIYFAPTHTTIQKPVCKLTFIQRSNSIHWSLAED